MPDFLGAEDLLGGLLSLGDPIVAGVFGIATVVIGWAFGRRKSNQELENLKAEKKSIEAASGVSHAEASQIIAQAAAETVRPLLERLQEYREENTEQDEKILELKRENKELKTHNSTLEAELQLIREQLRFQGATIPELPQEVKNYDSLS
jgi:cell division protein FtsB